LDERIPLKAHQLTPPLKVTRIETIDQMAPLLDFFTRCNGVLGWDIETNPLKDFFFRRCRTIQFGNQTEQYVIDLLPFCDWDSQLLRDAQGHYGKHLHLAPKLQEMLGMIAPVVCTKDYLKVGVNLGFEYMSFYWLFGQRTFHFFDCSVVEKTIWAGAHSLKDYGFFGMEEMMDRYFKVLIDKELQTSFNLEDKLTDEQIAYAALDTRFPMGLRAAQTLVLQGQTAKGLQAKGNAAWKTIANINPIVTGDNLLEIARIENDCVGSFQDMHVHGERIDRKKWLDRIIAKKAEMSNLIFNVLDPIFLPIVGSKLDLITDEEIEAAQAKWKSYNVISDEELKLKSAIRDAKKNDPGSVAGLEAQMTALAEGRKAEKEYWKTIAGDMGKKRTKIKNLAAQCEGNALINYGSDSQLLKVTQTMKGLKSVTSLNDEVLEKYEHIAVMAAIRKYHGLNKEIGTYGDQWALEWLTKPCKEEGWLHPGDGRLHCVFNQYDAETGRSSSEKPNGQNLPQDEEVRSCFIADPPNENIRVSNCCNADMGHITDPLNGVDKWNCLTCGKLYDIAETRAEEYVIITADMSGAELRIIAELADDPVWIGAFSRGEDVHSVGTEILYADKWPTLALPDCKYFAPKENGEPARKQCKCPDHKELRGATKSVNFLLAYGGGAFTLAARIKQTVEACKKIMALHEMKFPKIWSYLEQSGRKAKMLKKSFDMFGRRRLFPEPTNERAIEKAKSDREEQLRLDEDEAKANVEKFMMTYTRKPNPEELWILTHRQPSQKEISNAFLALASTIERQGKNHAVQGSNASIAKLAMGAGFDADGVPFLWHILPLFRAMLIKFVHDELVIQAPKHHAETVAAKVQDAFRRAAAVKMKKVVMESEYGIASYWKK
jgi:DNA polymerase I-like protein with 3'-5' exonuclease and polymerase domains